MRKRILSAFCFAFLFSFLVFSAYSGLFLARLDASTLFASLTLIAFVSCLLGAAVAFSVYQTEELDESFTIGTEFAEGVSNLARASVLLRAKVFAPFWISVSLICVGYFLLAARLSMLGGLVVCAGQIEWFLSRRKLENYVENSKDVPIRLADSLLWLLRFVDAFALLFVLVSLGSLGSYAETINNMGLLGLCFLLALAFMIFWYKTKGFPIDILFAIKTLLVMVWVLTITMSVNFGLDFRRPEKVSVISFRECPDQHNQYFTIGGEKIEPGTHDERFEDCKFFYAMEKSPGLDVRVQTIYHSGALGITWKKMQLLP